MGRQSYGSPIGVMSFWEGHEGSWGVGWVPFAYCLYTKEKASRLWINQPIVKGHLCMKRAEITFRLWSLKDIPSKSEHAEWSVSAKVSWIKSLLLLLSPFNLGRNTWVVARIGEIPWTGPSGWWTMIMLRLQEFPSQQKFLVILVTSNKCLTSSNRCIATRNRCIATSNKCLSCSCSFADF